MRVVLDTSVLIDHLRNGKASRSAFERLAKEKANIYIPTVVIYELFSGKSSKNASVEQEINQLIHNFKIIELSEKIAKVAGALYRDIGKTIGTSDYIIAASALEIDAIVVTLNIKHFSQISHLRVYNFDKQILNH